MTIHIAEWNCGSLILSLEDAECGHHQGRCDEDVEALTCDRDIAAQLVAIDPEKLAADLKGYGAWTPEELADHEANLLRFVWLSCGNITDDPEGTMLEPGGAP